jgi:hypothetical protein
LGERVTKKGGENIVSMTSDAVTDARSLQGTHLSRADDVQGAKGLIDMGTVPEPCLMLEHDRVYRIEEEVPKSDRRWPAFDGHPTNASIKSG